MKSEAPIWRDRGRSDGLRVLSSGIQRPRTQENVNVDYSSNRSENEIRPWTQTPFLGVAIEEENGVGVAVGLEDGERGMNAVHVGAVLSRLLSEGRLLIPGVADVSSPRPRGVSVTQLLILPEAVNVAI